jgi:hypothetical protein
VFFITFILFWFKPFLLFCFWVNSRLNQHLGLTQTGYLLGHSLRLCLVDLFYFVKVFFFFFFLRKGLFGRYTFNPILTILFYKKKKVYAKQSLYIYSLIKKILPKYIFYFIAYVQVLKNRLYMHIFLYKKIIKNSFYFACNFFFCIITSLLKP